MKKLFHIPVFHMAVFHSWPGCACSLLLAGSNCGLVAARMIKGPTQSGPVSPIAATFLFLQPSRILARVRKVKEKEREREKEKTGYIFWVIGIFILKHYIHFEF